MNEKRAAIGLSLVFAILFIPAVCLARRGDPNRIDIDFDRLDLVIMKDDQFDRRVQLIVHDMVVSVDKDYHFFVGRPQRHRHPKIFNLLLVRRHARWDNFYLQVNGETGRVYKVEGRTGTGKIARDGAMEGVTVTPVGDNLRVRFGAKAHPYLVASVKRRKIQIVVGGIVFHYGKEWKFRRVKSYLYHLKHKTWKSFFWAANTSRKEVYSVTGGRFGRLGGNYRKLPFVLRVNGERPVSGERRGSDEHGRSSGGHHRSGSGNGTSAHHGTGHVSEAASLGGGGASRSSRPAPSRVEIGFGRMQVLFTPDCRSLQVKTGNTVLSHGRDWQVRKLRDYLFHVRKKSWKNIYWKVNTSRKVVRVVEGSPGTFGRIGGKGRSLPAQVAVTARGLIKITFAGSANPCLRFRPRAKTVQISVYRTAIDYGRQWNVRKVARNLFKLRNSQWRGFYWQVDTRRGLVYRHSGSSRPQRLPFTVKAE